MADNPQIVESPDSAALRAQAEEEDRKRRAAAPKAPDPFSAQRQTEQQQGAKLKRFGSTPAERAGAIAGYAPGYGRSNPNNLGAGTPEISAIPVTHMASNAFTTPSATHMPSNVAAPSAPTHMASNVVTPTQLGGPPLPPQISAIPPVTPTFAPGQQVGTGTPGVIGALPQNQFGTGSSFIPLAGAKPVLDPMKLREVASAPKLSAVPVA